MPRRLGDDRIVGPGMVGTPRAADGQTAGGGDGRPTSCSRGFLTLCSGAEGAWLFLWVQRETPVPGRGDREG